MVTLAQSTAEPIANCTIEPLLGGISIAGLAALNDPAHEAMQVIDCECSQGCGAKLRATRFFASLVACDACRAKADKADKLEKAKSYWEAICPADYRDTDKTHPDFPKAVYASLSDYTGATSLLLFGPTRKGKTRVGMLLLKRCLVRYNMHVGVMWPEQLKAVRNGRDVLEHVKNWGRYDLLLMDDALLTGAQDERITDFLKDLFDYRMRHKRRQIITSQIGSDEYQEQSGKSDKTTKADMKRIQALLARIRETCRVVSFADAQPATPGEQHF